jgi:ribosomal protein S18 acetylase RimI-like enzyme
VSPPRNRQRPGRVADLEAVLALWGEEVVRGLRDATPPEPVVQRLAESFDWEARSRVIEDRGRLRAAVLVMEHSSAEGPVARVEIAARDEDARLDLLRWAVALSRAAGAAVAQVWRPRGIGPGMDELGPSVVRPFWRMDHPDPTRVPAVPLPPGYRLVPNPDQRVAALAFNRAFIGHWRFQPLDPRSPPTRPPDLDLLAVAKDGSAAAVVWCEIERHAPDLRPQPVGLVEAVGTVPEHRRRGLAYALTAEGVRRLLRRGARSVSLYVDGLNPDRAYDVYGRLGFRVAFEYDVFEVRLLRPTGRAGR